MSTPYDDIINLPHPVSKTHPQMSRHDRAAQFAPFAALNVHAGVIGKRTQEHIDEMNKEDTAVFDGFFYEDEE